MSLLDHLAVVQPCLKAVHATLQANHLPAANVIDQNPQALMAAMKLLGQQGWLSACLPETVGGQGMSARDFFLFQALLSRYSGALAFLQTQHQSAAGFIQGGVNEQLKACYLPAMARGQRLLGIGFSHLRRPTPSCWAIATDSGYQLQGEVPWVTGFETFEAFVGAAVLPSGEAVFGVLPLSDRTCSDSYISIGEPMALAAMASTNTVRVALENWFLPKDQVVDIKSPDWLPQRDRQGVLKAASFALGCAQASLDLWAMALEHKGWQSLRPAHEHLQSAVDHCLDTCLQAIDTPDPSTSAITHRHQLRAHAVALAGRCAQAVIAAIGGAANALSHPAQRLYREALVFTVTGQTPEVAAAICEELAERGRGKGEDSRGAGPWDGG